MITKFQNFKLIKESPDTIWVGNTRYYCEDDDAMPFFIIPNKDHTDIDKIFFGRKGGYHSDIYEVYDSNKKSYPGRVWLDGKIMTFWVYPNVDLFKKIIERLEDKLNIKMFNNGWRIEVLPNDTDSDGDIKRREYDPTNSDDYFYGGSRKGENVIPIEKYVGSEDVSEEQKIMHLMNWKEKELAKKQGKLHFPDHFGSALTAWDQPHNIKWRQAIYQEKHNLITENPDGIRLNDDDDGYLHYSNDEAIPFLCTVNKDHTKVKKVFFGTHGDSHASIEISDSKRAYPGRLWIKSKVIAFWVYPSVELFVNYIQKIEKELGIKIFNNGWKMEIIRRGGEIKRKKEDEDKYMNTGGYTYAEIVPIEEYAGSENVPEEEQIMHLMNWKEKELARQIGKLHFPDHFGSALTAWDQPYNIKWRQAIYQENKKN